MERCSLPPKFLLHVGGVTFLPVGDVSTIARTLYGYICHKVSLTPLSSLVATHRHRH